MFSPTFFTVRARADPVTIAIAAASLAASVLEMMKEAGATELLFKAVFLKLDAILDNQIRMMEVMAAMDQKLSDIQQLVMDIPAETVGLQAQIDAADATKNVVRWALKKNESEYRRFRIRLIDAASNVESTSRSATPPSLVCAGWHAIDGLNFIAKRDFKTLPVEDEIISAAVSDLRRAFMALQSSESTLSTRLAETRKRIADVEKQIEANEVFLVLPKAFAEITKVEPDGDASEIGETTLCVRRAEQEEVVSTERLHDIAPNGTVVPAGTATWVREKVSHRRIPVVAVGSVVFGGRQMVTLQVAPSNEWTRGEWTREVYRGTGGAGHRNPVRNVADPAQLDGCMEIPIDQDEYPNSLAALETLLATRNALVAVESGLLGLKTLCAHGLKRCEEIDGEAA